MGLRERGIYCLPNGRELVVICTREDGSVSYRLSCPNGSDAGEYEVSDDGRLFCKGRLTAWDVSNLCDTGRTVDPLAAWF
jgi:hypothetical protein